MHIKFLPSLFLVGRGPVAETKIGTLGNGLGDTVQVYLSGFSTSLDLG